MRTIDSRIRLVRFYCCELLEWRRLFRQHRSISTKLEVSTTSPLSLRKLPLRGHCEIDAKGHFRKLGGSSNSLRLEASGLDNRPPFLNFSFLKDTKRLRALLLTRRNFLAHLSQPLPNCRIG